MEKMDSMKEALSKLEGGWKSQKLRFVNTRLTKADMELLAQMLVKHDTVRSLEIALCEIEENVMVEFLGKLRNFNLIGMQLCHAGLRDPSGMALATALQECSIKKLDIAFNGLTGKSLQYIAVALQDCGLEALLISRNRLGVPGAKFLAGSLSQGGVTLKTLDLTRTFIQDAGASSILSALPQTGLEMLMLDWNSLTDEILPHLCQKVLETPSLVGLTVGRNLFTNFKPIIDLLEKPNMAKLGLDTSEHLDDEAAIQLAEVLPLAPHLECLLLHRCPRLTDRGGEALLKGMRAHPSLKALTLEDTGMSVDMVNKLTKYVALLHGERAKLMLALASVYIVPRVGLHTTFKYPNDLMRKLADYF